MSTYTKGNTEMTGTKQSKMMRVALTEKEHQLFKHLCGFKNVKLCDGAAWAIRRVLKEYSSDVKDRLNSLAEETDPEKVNADKGALI